MKEVIEVETPEGLKAIGYTSMMAPSNDREKGKIFLMFRLIDNVSQEDGDIHFFEKKGDRWVLLPNNSYINLQGCLVETYQNLKCNRDIDFSEFVRIICTALYTQ